MINYQLNSKRNGQTTYQHRQAGGTFLGIIIGLIIGLAIAVGVALVITKTPVPFVNRPAKEKTPDPTASQMADPNKNLYGNKEAAKEAAKDFNKETPTVLPAYTDSKPATPDPKAIAKPEGKPDAKAAVLDKSAADKVAVAAKDGAAKTESADDKWIFHLQVGAFRDQADAENSKAKLALQGFEAQLSERPSENGVLYRVRIGPFTQVEAMNKVRSKLSDNGVDVAVVRTPK